MRTNNRSNQYSRYTLGDTGSFFEPEPGERQPAGAPQQTHRLVSALTTPCGFALSSFPARAREAEQRRQQTAAETRDTL